MRIEKILTRLIAEEDGATAVEYAVMLVLIIVVCVAAITIVGSRTNNAFSIAANAVKT